MNSKAIAFINLLTLPVLVVLSPVVMLVSMLNEYGDYLDPKSSSCYYAEPVLTVFGDFFSSIKQGVINGYNKLRNSKTSNNGRLK